MQKRDCQIIRKLVIVCLLSLVICNLSLAQNIADLALKQGMGVRAMGLGGAYSAVANDASAVIYNPAGLAVPGFCYTVGNPDTAEKETTSSFDLLKLGYFGHASWRVHGPASEEVSVTATGFGNRSSWLNWGVTFKNLSWSLGGRAADGWSGDIGFLARLTPQFDLALVGRDLFTSKQLPVPGSLRLGFGFSPLEDRLLLASDLEFYGTAASYGNLGLEFQVVKGLAVRAGVNRGDLTSGLSLDLALLSFDYAVRYSQGQYLQSFETGIKILPQRERPFSIIKPKEYALIDVSGTIKGGRSQYSLLGGVTPGLDSILSQIRLAIKDPGIDGIMLKIGFSTGLGGMAIVQEIRSELVKAKQAGKKIVAYVEGSALGDEYYLAAVADKIVAPPGSAVGGFGKSIQIYRLKGLYEKIGLEQQIFAQGKYKDAFDPVRQKLSPEQREMTEGLLADLYRRLVTDLAEDRQLKIEKIKSISDGMIFPAKAAQQMGLIDEIGYYQDARKVAAKLCGEQQGEAKVITQDLIQPEEFFLNRVFGVAVIEIDGEIVSGQGGDNLLFGDRYVGAETVIDYIHKASDDLFVKAIILRIDSPGGDAIASGEIYKALAYAKKKDKLLIASIGSIGASGGYYIAAAADKIVADPSGLTGSIGVIGHHMVIKDLLKKFDVETEVIKEGQHADMFSGLRRLTSEEGAAIERLQRESYDEFVGAVARGRHLATEEVRSLAEGRLYTGAQAFDKKLVDKLGGLVEAVDLAKQEAKISGEPRLIFFHQPNPFFSFGDGLVESLGIKALVGRSFWDWLLPGSLSQSSGVLQYN